MERKLIILLLFVTGLYALAGSVRIAKYDWNYTTPVAFGCVNETLCYARQNEASLPSGTLVFRGGGYDGQFFYYIAAYLYGGPGPRLDSDSFRLARIFYPLLAGPAYLLGPQALVWSLFLLPVLIHLSALIVLYRLTGASESRGAYLALVGYGLNPFSLLCFRLCLADGPALSFGAIAGVLFLQTLSRPAEPASAGARDKERNLWLVGVLFVLALLSKETMLALWAGSAAACIAVVTGLFGGGFRAPAKASLTALLPAPLLLFGWWFLVGFSPGLAAERGGAPFAGLWSYLRGDPDTLYSPRGLLTVLLAAMVVQVCVCMYGAWRNRLKAGVRAAVLLAAGVTGALTIGLISAATGDEYWGTFPNIGRLFTPFMALPLLLVAASGGAPTKERSANTGKNEIWSYRLLFVFVCFLGLFSLTLILRDARGAPLAWFLLP